ncbi:uncharacterized protein LOC105843959 isoform X1 [Hydra vulgaris]|uniref:uncharacterized protein LOC105843959 isoform X1 n=1 Tax=Hydra vulgaris TaxID=6087 RepID=UPI001F5F3EA3|nr:uncharacterized protein LOC105843959 [Hydra vulgaris]
MDKIKEEYDKKKFQELTNNMFKIGCIKGFRYFSMYLRGKEELLVKVQNEQVPLHPVEKRFYQETVTEEGSEEEENGSFNDKPLPRLCDSLIMSRSTQQRLSGLTFSGLGLLPASPSESEVVSESSSTLFLIGAYSRYKSPYVWIRSNHHRIVSFTDIRTYQDLDEVKDSPLKLKSISNWHHKDIHLWDILSDIIRLNVQPTPKNPFAVDFSYFDALSPNYFLLATGAMVHFLNCVLTSGEHSYNADVTEDLNEVMRRHFMLLNTMVSKNR